jgi:hypothetical protein
MIYGKPYKYPPPAFHPGEWARFYLSDDIREHGRGAYQVVASDHCFTWFDEFPHQISNWRLKKVPQRQKPGQTGQTSIVRKKKNSDHRRNTEDLDAIAEVKSPVENIFYTSEEIPYSSHPTGESYFYFFETRPPSGFRPLINFQFSRKYPPLEA